jgi:hypothetical protein
MKYMKQFTLKASGELRATAALALGKEFPVLFE